MIHIAARLKHFLDSHRVVYRVLHHDRTESFAKIETLFNIPKNELLTVCFFELDKHPISFTYPYGHKINPDRLEEIFGHTLKIIDSALMNPFYVDCESFAPSPFGEPYEIKSYYDKSILKSNRVYFKPGSHNAIVQMDIEEFQFITSGAPFIQCTEPKKDKETRLKEKTGLPLLEK